MQLIILFSIFVLVRGSHFRGGYIVWKPKAGSTTEIEITYRIAWRRSSSGNYCDASTVSTTKSGEGTLYCQTCSPKITIKNPMSYVCTDFSVSEDWTAGENTVTFDFTRANSPSFYVGYSDCCWITLENGGAMSMSVMSLVNTTSIDRNGVMKINSSPVTSVSPVTRLIQNCNYTITIPVSDPDGDVIRCRWAVANGVVNECGPNPCQQVPDATLIEDECKLVVQPTSTGYYGVILQIEDFLSSSDTTPLSSVPLQFLLNVVSSSTGCSAIPSFTGDTLAAGSRVNIVIGTTFNMQIIVNSTSTITELNTLSPPTNLVTTSPERLTSTGTEWYSNVTWTPTSEQEGDHIFCFSVKTSNGDTSEQRCVILSVAGFNMNSYTCDPQSGGVYQQCVKMPPYDDFQITYCVSADDVLARTNNTRRCADTCREYCYLTCMAEMYGDQYTTEVTSECICGTSGNTDAETQLPKWCLTPQGNCDFFSSCVPSRFSSCDNVKNAMTELQEQCLWFAGKSLNQNCSSNNWIRDVRKCFQSYLMTSVFLADVSLCSDFTDTLYHEAYVVCFSDTTYDEHFCQLPESFRLAFNAELVPFIPMAVQQDNAVNNLLDSMANC